MLMINYYGDGGACTLSMIFAIMVMMRVLDEEGIVKKDLI